MNHERFIKFLYSLKNEYNKSLIESVEKGFDACFEAKEKIDPEKTFVPEEDKDFLKSRDKHIRKKTGGRFSLNDFYDPKELEGKTIKEVHKNIYGKLREKLKKESKLGRALELGAKESPALGVASGLYGMGKGLFTAGKKLLKK